MKRSALALMLSLAAVSAHASDNAQTSASSFIDELLARILLQQPSTGDVSTLGSPSREQGVVKPR